MDDKDFDICRNSLDRQIREEIIDLRDGLSLISEEDLKDTCEAAKAISLIFSTMNGIEKLCHALEYISCWEDNGDPPNISRNNRIQTFDEHASKT